jgi:hypothetical protein
MHAYQMKECRERKKKNQSSDLTRKALATLIVMIWSMIFLLIPD